MDTPAWRATSAMLTSAEVVFDPRTPITIATIDRIVTQTFEARM